jgi:hypothetical protein
LVAAAPAREVEEAGAVWALDSVADGAAVLAEVVLLSEPLSTWAFVGSRVPHFSLMSLLHLSWPRELPVFCPMQSA